MATRSAVYIFRNRFLGGIRLRHIFNPLRCISIKQAKDRIIFELLSEDEQREVPKQIFDLASRHIDKDFDQFIDSDAESNNELPVEPNKEENPHTGNLKDNLLSNDEQLQDLENGEAESEDENALKKKDKKKKKLNYCEKYNFPPGTVQIRVDTDDAAYLVYRLVEIYQKHIFGVTNQYLQEHMPQIKCDISLPNAPQQRERNSLKKRAIFLSHYDKSPGSGRVGKVTFDPQRNKVVSYSTAYRKLRTALDMSDYFKNKWDGSPVLTIGREFHPGTFGKAFGRAVAWEHLIDTVIFRAATFTQIPLFIKSLLSYSETIDRIIFLDYDRSLNFSFDLSLYSPDSSLQMDSNIRKWWFVNTSSTLILSFLNASDQLAKPFDELLIGRYSFSTKDTDKLFDKIKTVPVLHHVPTLKFVGCKFRTFNYPQFQSVCESFQNLQTLYFKNISNVDGSLLLTAICKANCKIHQLSLIKMRFEHAMQAGLNLPKGLVFLDVSKSQFINLSFASFLWGISSRRAAQPFILNARKLRIGYDEFALLSKIVISRCHPNFLEVNFSHNNIPTYNNKRFFDILAMQSRLKHLVLYDVTTDDPAKLISQIITILEKSNAEGLDIGFHFEQTIIRVFLSLLHRCTNLTRLTIKNCAAGNAGLETICSLFQLLQNLRELACDGFRPTPMTPEEIEARPSHLHPLMELWKKIGQSKTIERNDWPTQDLEMAQLKFDPSQRRDEIWIEELKSRKKPKTQQERIQETLEQLKAEESAHNKEAFAKEKSKANKNRYGGDRNDSSSDYEYEDNEHPLGDPLKSDNKGVQNDSSSDYASDDEKNRQQFSFKDLSGPRSINSFKNANFAGPKTFNPFGMGKNASRSPKNANVSGPKSLNQFKIDKKSSKSRSKASPAPEPKSHNSFKNGIKSSSHAPKDDLVTGPKSHNSFKSGKNSSSHAPKDDIDVGPKSVHSFKSGKNSSAHPPKESSAHQSNNSYKSANRYSSKKPVFSDSSSSD